MTLKMKICRPNDQLYLCQCYFYEIDNKRTYMGGSGDSKGRISGLQTTT